MNKSLLFRNRFYDFCLILLSFFILLYLIYQFIASNRGLLQYFILESEFSNKNNQYIKKLNINTNLQKKINKLNPNSIDLEDNKNLGWVNDIYIVKIQQDDMDGVFSFTNFLTRLYKIKAERMIAIIK